VSVARGASPPASQPIPPLPGSLTPHAPGHLLQPDQAAVTVVVVDNSSAERRFLRSAITADPCLCVVGEARSGRDALALVERLRPAAVVLDLDLFGMSAIDIIERIMASVPTPILVCSTEGDAERVAAALAAGAVDIVARPTSPDADRGSYAEALRRGVRVAARVRVITHPRGRLKNRVVAASPPASGGRDQVDGSDITATSDTPMRGLTEGTVDLVVIGASTGGPQALAQLLGALPADFGPPIIVVQHMADGFIEGLAAWLDALCALPVTVAKAGAKLSPGTVTIAPGASNLIVNDHLRITIEKPPITQFHVPGVDATFESVARNIGPRAIGVLLTGMGRDGAIGLKAMRDAGAITIGQDEESSAVWGMPAAAAANGAVQRQLSLTEMAAALVEIIVGDAFGGER
jgi:two-component system, chemotaxis family, protein-glutamate methylesterase/glutaminase